MVALVVSSGLQSARSIVPATVAGVQSLYYSTESIHAIKSSSLSALKRGTGGRSSFNGVIATVFGAGGFLGRYVCNKLGKIGSQVIVPYRGDPYDVLPLKLCGDLGQILFYPFYPRDEESIHKAIKYSNVVINLIGRDWETKNFTFHDANVKVPRTIARIAKEHGVEKFVHISHLNAAEKPKSHVVPGGSKYLACKWESEQVVRQEFPDAIIFKPSDIYGAEDRFLRTYAHIWRHTIHMLPLWKKGEHTVKQPVYVSDVAAGIVAAIKDSSAVGRTYHAVGPKRYKLSDLVDYLHNVMRKDEKNWSYSRIDLKYDLTYKLKVAFTDKFLGTPVANLGLDTLERECVSDKYEPGVPTLEDLGVTLTHLEDQAPWDLLHHRAFMYYEERPGDFDQVSPPPTVPF